jgi:pimeloyl-ACP methyl ester carboxylesterase
MIFWIYLFTTTSKFLFALSLSNTFHDRKNAFQIETVTKLKEFRTGLINHSVRLQNLDSKKFKSPLNLVFLPGFGVGTFHYDRNMASIIEMMNLKGENVLCHSIDWLGQGKSWPTSFESTKGLQYSASTWCEQLQWFLETELNGEPAILIGNSLGGYMAVQLAAIRPDVVQGLVLINATPIWSFQPPLLSTIENINLWDKILHELRPFGWKADLPPPPLLRLLGGNLFETLKNKEIIKGMLQQVYQLNNFDDNLIDSIQQAASHPSGPDAFTSIMFAPRMPYSFEEQLLKLDSKIPCLLLYGAEDPWVVPFWGDRTYRRLIKREHSNAEEILRNTIQYYITPCGHCAHHEASAMVCL